jgi:hypothetical protein
MVKEAQRATVSEEIDVEDMLHRPAALVEKQRRGPFEEPVNETFQRPVVEGEVPEIIKEVEAEDQNEKQPHVEVRLVTLVGVKGFYFFLI